MKYAWLLLLMIICVACTKSGQTPLEEDFAVTIRTSGGKMKSGEDIELIAELTNQSKHAVKVLHASPLIQVQVYDEQNRPQIDMLFTDSIGLHHQLEPGEAYNPDSKIYNSGRRTVKVDSPGKYKLVGTASFSIELGKEGRRDYKIVSEPVWITVEEGMQTLAATVDEIFQLKIDPADQVDGKYKQVVVTDRAGHRSQTFDWQVNSNPDALAADLQMADLDGDGTEELVVLLDDAVHVIDTRSLTEIPVESAADYLEQTYESQIFSRDEYKWVQIRDSNGQIYLKAIDSTAVAEWGDAVQFGRQVHYEIADRPLRLFATADAVVGIGEEMLRIGHINLSYGFTKQGVTVDIAGGLQLNQELKGEIPISAIQAGGSYISLWESSDDDVKSLLGRPNEETIRQLGPEADTFDGTYLKMLLYDGLEIILASGDGTRFRVINMRVTDRRYATSLGIRVGDLSAQVEEAYPGIEIAKDGRTPPYNYAYLLDEGVATGLLIDMKEGIVNELYLEYLMD